MPSDANTLLFTNHTDNIMANINKIEMGKTVSALPYINIEKSFFGLKQTICYKPTNSEVQIVQYEYAADNGATIQKLLNTKPAEAAALIEKVRMLDKAPMGNFRLDACVSADKQFVALQLFQYSNLMFHPATDVKIYQGEDAKLMASIL